MPRAYSAAWPLLVAASVLFLPARAAAQLSTASAASHLSLLDVPYLSQSEALCGGAAAAMVLRYWGARGTAAEDFAHLVDRARGGIDTAALAGAVRERGYDAHAASGTPALVERELAAGRPVIALVEDRPGAFHYVVVVGWHARAVVLHDPARTPYMLAEPGEFLRRWQASANWMLAIVPRTPATPSSESAPASGGSLPSEPGARVDGGRNKPCEMLVQDGVLLARQNDLAGAERLLTDAAYRCPGAAPARELAGVRVLQRRWPEVLELAARAVDLDPDDAHAWRLLATARYISDDRAAALDAWNRAGEPRVDLVSVIGLQRTSHGVVEQLLGIDRGAVLTRTGLGRAERRLAELPAAIATRAEYVPRGSGVADVRAHVVERTLFPNGKVTWAAIGLRAAASRELVVGVAGLGHGGERLDASWRFWPERPAAGVALHVPGRAGVLSLELTSERQPFTEAAAPDAERLTALGRLGTWATAELRWEVRGGIARWRGVGSFAAFGGTVRAERGPVRASLDVDGWSGSSRFGSGALHVGWRSSRERRGFVADLSGGLLAVTSAAPLDVWPAGDTGHARATLLRAHPILDDGRLRVDRLGRLLLHSTIEAQHWWRAATVVPIGAALFVDAARLGRRPPTGRGEAVADVDAGAGLRLALPGRAGLFRVDVAHGLRDGRNAVSIAWQP